MADKLLALITGASAGLGMEYARQLSLKGYDLILVARRKEKLDSLAAELMAKHGNRIETLKADLSQIEGIKSVEEYITAHPSLQMLINNAGYGEPGKYVELSVEHAMNMITVHVIATARLTRVALPAMIANHSGVIINVSSISAFTGPGGHPSYTATKAYLKNFSEALASELYGTGVLVQAVCPGLTHTEFHSSPEYKAEGYFDKIPEPMWMSAKRVVEGSLNAVGHSTVYVPGFGNKLFAWLGNSGLFALGVRLNLAFSKKRN